MVEISGTPCSPVKHKRSEHSVSGGVVPLVAVVEPDILLRTLLVRALRAAGYAPVVCSSCTELARVSEAEHFLLAIVDELAETSITVAARVPVLLLASEGGARVDGPWQVVAKPFSIEEVLATVRRLIPDDHGERDGPYL